MPWPSIVNPVVYQPLPAPGGPGGGSADIGGGGCSINRIELFDCCGGFYARLKDTCGKCYVLYLQDKPESGTRELPFDLDDGSTVTAILNSSGSATFHVVYNDGTEVDFSLGAPALGNLWTTSAGPTSITDPNDQETTFSYEDTFDTVTTPDGDIWRYYHPSGDTKITKIEQQVTDAPYVDIAYMPSGSAAGKLQTVAQKDHEGNVQSQTSYAYYDDGRLNTVTRSGRIRKFEYSEDGRKITVKEMSDSQVLTETEWDYGSVTSSTTTITRKHPTDTNKNQVTVYEFYMTGDLGEKKSYVHSITDPMNRVTTYEVDGNGRVDSVMDPSGMTTSYTYNAKGAVTQTTNTTSDYQYSTDYNTYYTDGNGATVWLKTHKDNRGAWTYYERDPDTLWQVDAVKIAPPGDEPEDWGEVDPIKEYTYYGSNEDYGMLGQVEQEKTHLDESNVQVTTYRYNEGTKKRNSPTQTIYQYWDSGYTTATSTTSYDDEGRVLSATDDDGRTVWHRYDALGRPTLTVYKWVNGTVDGTPEVYTQNHYTCCTMDWSRDENGNQTHYAYDGLNRVSKTWTSIPGQSEETPLVEYTYDAFGNRQTVTTRSAAGTGMDRATTYTYDKMNRVTEIEYPDEIVGDEEFGYTNAGSLLWEKDGNGYYTYHKYDTWGRLTNVYHNAGTPQVPFVYPTGNGQVQYGYEGQTSLKTSMVDASGTSSYTYDAQGRLDHYTPSGLSSGYYIDYDYDYTGQKTAVKITNGTVTPYDVSYEYYTNGWLRYVKWGAQTIASYTYDSVGNRKQVTYGNSTYQTFGYKATDPRYLLENIHYWYNCGSGIADQGGLSFTRDDLGNPLRWGDTQGLYTRKYTYDENSRLGSANLPGNAPIDYVYDWVGNRTSPGGMQYNTADQLTSLPGQHLYEYYNDGSLHYQKDGSGNVQKTHNYTFAGLLSSVQHTGQGTSSMTWDADSNRVGFTSSTDQSHPYTFVYDPTAGIPAVIEELHNGASVYYIREPGGALIARIEGETTQYYHFDDLGSTLFLTGSNGTVTDRYTYDAWGNLPNHDGNTNQPYQYVGQLGYYTHFQDTNMDGLLQLGVRYYAPKVARFTQGDAIQSDIYQSYAYAMDRPTTGKDPSGRWPTFIIGRSCYRQLTSSIFQIVKDAIDLMHKYLNDTKTPGLLETCNKSIFIQCWLGSCRRTPGLCGHGNPLSDVIQVSNAPGCPSLQCLILHEAVHSCGMIGHNDRKWDRAWVPGCGKLSVGRD